MTSLLHVNERIRHFICQSYLDAGSAALDEQTLLLELNIIDSASLFDIVDFIYQEFSVRVPLSEIQPDNFRSIAVLGQVVVRLSTEGEAV